MKTVFADTFYFLAWNNAKDRAHEWACEYARQRDIGLVTTAWVLTEVANALCGINTRLSVRTLLEPLKRNPNHTIVPPDSDLFHQGLSLYYSRPDKEWSLTDCISFLVMEDRKIREALTGDRHFAQAGFEILYKA
jgi:uncharacterized protein